MLSFLPSFFTGLVTVSGMALNTVLCAIPLYIITLFKLLLPIRTWQTACTKILISIAETWISINDAIFRVMHHRHFIISGLEGLSYEEWYLVISNHVSTADIFVLQTVFNRHIPFLKFFIKQELIWVPVIGLAWWALDFPFMKRYSKEYLKKYPEKQGKDLETTRRACEKFKDTPISIINFLEGTRITPQKHGSQQSAYTHLLNPKAGGVALVTTVMGEYFHKLLDITLVYPHETKLGFWDFLCGRIPQVIVHIKQLPIPPSLLEGDYNNDPAFREQFQEWVNRLWAEKDLLIGRLLAEHQHHLAQVH